MYRYRVANLITGKWLGHLDLACKNFSAGINTIGELNATLTHDSNSTFNWRSIAHPNLIPGLFVEKNFRLLWGGIIWKARPDIETDPSGNTTGFLINTLESFLDANRCPDLICLDMDQADILRKIIETLSSITGCNLRWTLIAPASTGITRTVIINSYEDRSFWDVIKTELCDPENGLEITIGPSVDAGGNPMNVIRAGYPKLGNQNSNLVFEYPGNIIKHPDITINARLGPSEVKVIGAGEDESMLTATKIDEDRLNNFIPRTSKTYPRKELTDQAQVSATANELMVAGLDATEIPTITVLGNSDPVYGSYQFGDLARLRLKSGFYGPKVFETYRRITAANVMPEARSQIDLVELTFARGKTSEE